jgi:HEPN domain-containing protein
VVKPVDKKLYRNYLQKAEEMLEMARYAVTSSKNNAAVVASIHCAINAMDALSVFYFGKRQSGMHETALDLLRGALSEGEFKEVSKQFGGLIELKNQAEYQPDLMDQRQAADAVRRAERILSK